MKSPYEILEVAEDSDDRQIKKAYLAMVRRYPPERFPDDFQRMYQAYELIKTEEDRLSYELFHCQAPTVADLAEILLSQVSAETGQTEEQFRTQLGKDLQATLARFQL